MKSIVAVLGILFGALSAECQTNVYSLNYTFDGFITVGNNRSTVKIPGALTKTYGESRNQPVSLGSLVKFTYFNLPPDKSGSPQCNWIVNSVEKLGPILKDNDGSQIAKTDGGFIKVTFTLSNAGKKSIYLKSESLFIRMHRDKKDYDHESNPELPCFRSDQVAGEDCAIVGRSDLPPGITRTYAVVYEVPLNIQSATFDVRPLSDDVGVERIRVPIILW